MKKSALLIVFILSLLSPLAAAENKESLTNYTYYNGYGELFTFVERGITFSVFQNGEFDFYINPNSGVNVGVNLDGVSLSYNSGYDYDAFVQYDDYGAIVQIEDVPIYYDHYGRISRAGNVRIYYNNGRLHRVGGLYIHYNRFGVYSHYTGFINRWNTRYVYHPYHNFFVRPVFNRCIVSFNPYRRYYNPVRYTYYRGRGYDRGYRYRNYRRDGRSFRSIDARIRTNNDSRRVARRYNDARRNDVRSVRRNDGVRRSTQQRSVQRNNSRSVDRRTQNGVRRSNSGVAQRRGNSVRANTKPGVQRNSTVQRRSTSPRAAEQRRTVERRQNRTTVGERRTAQRRSATPRVQQRSTSQRRVQSQARTQKRNAPQKRVLQRSSTSKKYNTRSTQSTVRKQSSGKSTQRNGNRRVNSRRSL